MSEVFGVAGGHDLLQIQTTPQSTRIMTPTQVMQHRAERERERERTREREQEQERERQRLREVENARYREASAAATHAAPSAPIPTVNSTSSGAVGVAQNSAYHPTARADHRRTASAVDHTHGIANQGPPTAIPLSQPGRSIPPLSRPSQQPTHARTQSYTDAPHTVTDHQSQRPSGKHHPPPPSTTQVQQSTRTHREGPSATAPTQPPAQNRPKQTATKSQAAPALTSLPATDPGALSAVQQPSKARASSFPHAFERWENLSAHWEGLTSYWIRKLEMNASDVRNEPLLQQMSRQINDLTAAGANLFHAVVELQRLRASSERKFQRWFIEVRGEMERLEEANGKTTTALDSERRTRARLQTEIDVLQRRAGENTENVTQTNNELRRALDVSKEEACRAWEELGRREQEERDRCTDLREGRPINVCGVWIYPTSQVTRQMSVKRPDVEADPESFQTEFVEANFVYGQNPQQVQATHPMHSEMEATPDHIQSTEHHKPQHVHQSQHVHQPQHAHQFQHPHQQQQQQQPPQAAYGSDPFMDVVEKPEMYAPAPHGAIPAHVGQVAVHSEPDVKPARPEYYNHDVSSATTFQTVRSPMTPPTTTGFPAAVSNPVAHTSSHMHPSTRAPVVDYQRSQKSQQRPQSSSLREVQQQQPAASYDSLNMSGTTRKVPDYEGQAYADVEDEWPLQNPATVTSSGIGVGIGPSKTQAHHKQQQQQQQQQQTQQTQQAQSNPPSALTSQQHQHHYLSRLSDVLEEDEASSHTGRNRV